MFENSTAEIFYIKYEENTIYIFVALSFSFSCALSAHIFIICENKKLKKSQIQRFLLTFVINMNKIPGPKQKIHFSSFQLLSLNETPRKCSVVQKFYQIQIVIVME